MLLVRTLARFILALIFLLLPAVSASAQDRDMAEVQQYTLTMEKINHFKGLLTDLQAYGKAHPAEMQQIKQSMETDADKHEDLAAMTSRINSNAAVVDMLKKNGWTAHEFAVFQTAFIQAMMASAMKPADEPDAKYASEVHMNPANLVFMREHSTEIAAMMQSFKGDQ